MLDGARGRALLPVNRKLQISMECGFHSTLMSRWNLLHVSEFMLGMIDFPIDPVLLIRGAPQRVLQRTGDAVKFVKQMMLARPDGAMDDALAGSSRRSG